MDDYKRDPDVHGYEATMSFLDFKEEWMSGEDDECNVPVVCSVTTNAVRMTFWQPRKSAVYKVTVMTPTKLTKTKLLTWYFKTKQKVLAE